jgi:NADPH:quinone reductase-like Zn-dependent oxidoreductase
VRLICALGVTAAADFVVVMTPPGSAGALLHTPDGISDDVASTLPVAATAAAALAAIGLRSGDTVLIGGAAGGVGGFAVQLARLALATVIGTASEGTFAFLRKLTDAILAGKITVPITATFPIEQIRDAVTLQAGRHVHGKIVITL